MQYTSADRARDPDFDPWHSEMKRGGYQWAGAWIDPKVKPRTAGVVEHPTLSELESFNRFATAVERNRAYKKYRDKKLNPRSLFSDESMEAL